MNTQNQDIPELHKLSVKTLCKEITATAAPEAPQDEWDLRRKISWNDWARKRGLVYENLIKINPNELMQLLAQRDELLAAAKFAISSRLFSIDDERNRTIGSEQTDVRNALVTAIVNAERGAQ